MRFATLRLIAFILMASAQVYLVIRSWRIIRSWRQSDRFKALAIGLVIAAVGFLFLMNEYLMARPIAWLDPPIPARVILFYLPAVWGFGSVFSALLLVLLQVGNGLSSLIDLFFREHPAGPVPPAVDPGRRRFLQVGMGAVAAVPFVVAGYGATYGTRAYEVEHLTLPFGQPLRVVQLTDIHAGPFMSRKDMRRYVDQVAALEPDLFVLTGDYISNSIVFLDGCLAEMARIQAPYGTVATLGNHEHWYGKLGEIQRLFRVYRIPLLINRHLVIETRRGRFAVAGIDDLRAGRPDLEAALHGLDDDIPTLLLSHRPEIFPQAAARGIPLTLSGHYHGGQIKLSLAGRDISVAEYWTPYPQGLYRIQSSHLYVSRGIGTTFTPIRLNARPEVTVFQLT